MGGRASLLLPALLALAGPLVFDTSAFSQDGEKGQDQKQSPAPARVKVIKVWASDRPEKKDPEKKDEKSKGASGAPKDELKEYRQDLEEQTHKKHFAIEGKVEIQDAIPSKVLPIALLEDYKLEITPTVEGKADQEKLVLLLSLKKGKVEKRAYKLCGTKALIYQMPLHDKDRDLVVIIQKLPAAKEPAPSPSK